LRQDLVNALATKLESTIFGSHAKSATMPDGFFSTLPAAGGVMDWDKIVGMETSVDVSNALAGNLAYVMHPSLFGKAKTTVKKSAGALGFIAENDGSINGYKVLRTNAMSKGLQTAKDEYGILFGNWADFIIGQWGAIDLTVDPYTQSTEAMIRIVVNAYFDAGTRRTASFSTSTMK
ncbi:MAG: phage major capsid protein, partial [Bacteroides sp.]